MKMTTIRTHPEQELETNQTQKKEKDLCGLIVQRSTIYIHPGKANRARFIDDSSNLYRATQELIARNKLKFSHYFNYLYNTLRSIQKLFRRSASIAADKEPRKHRFLPHGLTAFN